MAEIELPMSIGEDSDETTSCAKALPYINKITSFDGRPIGIDFVQNTPEYIHPRKQNDMQWLMSPPQISNKKLSSCVRKKLLKPDDFVVGCMEKVENVHSFSSLCSDLQGVGNVQNGSQLNASDCEKCPVVCDRSLCSDSGISTPLTPLSDVDLLDKLQCLCKTFENCSDILQQLQKKMSCNGCNSLLSLLVTLSLCSDSQHQCCTCAVSKLLPSSDSKTHMGESPKKQYPIAVFWDIENCQVPTGKSAFDIVQKIRKTYFADHREIEFMAVCDINKETKQVVQDLNNAQVNVVHVNATAKNAADDKLRQSIRRFAQSYTAPATVVLVTGDCNFTAEVSDLRHRHQLFVVLLHKSNSSECLKQAAHSTVLYEEFVRDLPIVYPCLPNSLYVRDAMSKHHLHITNLPCNADVRGIRAALRQLSSNCGGKVVNLNPPYASLRFTTQELADRALIRLNGEVVFGSKISVLRNKPVQSGQLPPRRVAQKTTNNSKPAQKTLQGNGNNRTVEMSKKSVKKPSQASQLISISITNIDAELGGETIKNSITKLVSQYCEVLQLQILPHNRFTVTCDVTVANKENALRVLTKLHRRRLGGKRILVMISSNNQFSLDLFRNEVIPLLKQYDDIGCPFYELAAMYNRKYHKILKVANLQLIDDVVKLEDASDGLIVYPNIENIKKMSFSCRAHRKLRRKARSDLIINIPLHEFSSKLHVLLLMHNGSLYLDSLEECYEAEFGSFPHAENPDEGVHLEHELSYVPGIVVVAGEVKVITWMPRKSDIGSEPPMNPRFMTSQMIKLSKQLVEFLKLYPRSSIALSDLKSIYQDRFADSYPVHHSDEVEEILSALPHVVQVIGKPGGELVVLLHRTQVKRFTSELIKMLKSQPNKTITTSQLPHVYEREFGRTWNLYNYGVNSLTDLLDDIPDSTVCVTDDVIVLPTRERTEEQIARTLQFSRELVEILKSRPQYRIPLKDFIPIYHRQFGRQCRLAKFGFNKLCDLFESMPQVVQVVESASEKFLQLSREEKLKALTAQILALFCDSDGSAVGVPLLRLQALFTRKYGRPLTPRDYNCDNIEAVMKLLPHAVQLFTCDDGAIMIRQSERKPIRLLAVQLLVLLLDIDDQQLKLEQLHRAYVDRYKEEVTSTHYGFATLENVVSKALSGIAQVELKGDNSNVILNPIYVRAKRIRNILLQNGGSMTLGEFNRSYREKHMESLDADRFGFPSCEALLRAIPLVVSVKGFGIKKTVLLRNHMHYGPLSGSLGGALPTSEAPQLSSFPTVTDVESSLLSIDEHSKKETKPSQAFSSVFHSSLVYPGCNFKVHPAIPCTVSHLQNPQDLCLSYLQYRQLQHCSQQSRALYPS